MSDEIKRIPDPKAGLTRINSLGHRLERRRAVAIETIGGNDTVCRSLRPGGPLPKRYSRNLIAEVFAERYGNEPLSQEAEVTEAALEAAPRIAEPQQAEAKPEEPKKPAAQRVVVARKAGAGWAEDEGDEDQGGGPAAPSQLAKPEAEAKKPEKPGSFFGFAWR